MKNKKIKIRVLHPVKPFAWEILLRHLLHPLKCANRAKLKRLKQNHPLANSRVVPASSCTKPSRIV